MRALAVDDGLEVLRHEALQEGGGVGPADDHEPARKRAVIVHAPASMPAAGPPPVTDSRPG